MNGETLFSRGVAPLLRAVGPVEIGGVEVRMKESSSDGRWVLRLGVLGLIAGLAALTAGQWPDIQRYMKMKNM